MNVDMVVRFPVGGVRLLLTALNQQAVREGGTCTPGKTDCPILHEAAISAVSSAIAVHR